MPDPIIIDDEDTAEAEGKSIYSGFDDFMKENLDKQRKMMYINVKEDDDGELYLELPDQFMDELGWDVGDTLSWHQESDVSWSITKVKDE